MEKSNSEKRFAAVIKHVAHEGLGLIEQCLVDATIDFRYFNPDDPALDRINPDFLIVMGGPMSVYDDYPWLEREAGMIRRVIGDGKPVLGICLGAQLMAAALGARVMPCGAKEIGWYPLEACPAGVDDPLFSQLKSTETVFQWHGDTFELPEGAELLASSPLCPHQAFRYGRAAYALQFHLEVTADMAGKWLALPENQEEIASLHGAGGIGAISADTVRYASRLEELGRRVFTSFLKL